MSEQRKLPTLLLNCDLGEETDTRPMHIEKQVMSWIDMASIACGFHAGSPQIMAATVQLAKQSGTKIGAHPSYPDRAEFGRRSMLCSGAEIIAMLHYQIGALQAICQAQDVNVSYVKPHGALYNDMMRQPSILRAVVQAVAEYDASLPLMVLSQADNDVALQIAEAFNVTLLFEAFADRAYNDDGQLLSRQHPQAVYKDPQQIIDQSLLLAEQGIVKTLQGKHLTLHADSLCVHGDNPASVSVIKQLRQSIDAFYATR